MSTSLSSDPDLQNEALRKGSEKAKKATVNRALREFLARRKQKGIVELFGKLEWDDEFDYKQERSRG